MVFQICAKVKEKDCKNGQILQTHITVFGYKWNG